MVSPDRAPRAASATRLLDRLCAGDAAAADELLPLVYGELHRVAERCMRGEDTRHTLQPTALVHEAWLRLVGGDATREWESEGHFLRVAARAMRNVLVDHARARKAQKRGRRARGEYLDELMGAYEERSIDVLALHDVLQKLAGLDEQRARIVELRFFAGLSVAETARALGASPDAVKRQWRTARAWLRTQLPATE